MKFFEREPKLMRERRSLPLPRSFRGRRESLLHRELTTLTKKPIRRGYTRSRLVYPILCSSIDQGGERRGLSKIGWTMEMQGILATQSINFQQFDLMNH